MSAGKPHAAAASNIGWKFEQQVKSTVARLREANQQILLGIDPRGQ
jgi:hypothetical protein